MEDLMGLFFGLLIIGVFIGVFVLFIIASMKIAKKAGYHPVMGLLTLIPYLNIIFILIFAFSKWPIYDYIDEEKVKPQKSLPGIALFFIILAGSIPFLALLAAIAIPNFLRARISANDALAKASLRTLSTASESYAADNNGVYPDKISALLNSDSPYINTDYCQGAPISGFIYECETAPSGYKYIAVPAEKGASGSKIFSVVTGGIMTEEELKR